MPVRPTPQPGVMQIAPYVPGRSGAGSDAPLRTYKLSSNESPLGASPRAIAALEGLGNVVASYPDGSYMALREAIAHVQGLEAERLIIGAGSDELLHLLAQTFLGEGDEAIISQFGFLVYPIATRGAGATPVFAKDNDFCVDVDAMLGAVTQRTKVVFLANPNNPTGTYISQAELVRLHAGLRPDILLVVDSAYAEYVTADDYAAGEALVRDNDNVVMVRTFSKIGLAALRIGWMYGPPHIVDAVNRLRGPFNVNRAAQLAGEAAAKDVEFIVRLKAHNKKWRDWLSDELNSNQIRILPSQGNFVLALFAEEGGRSAKEANAALLEAGLIVREMGAYGLPDALRISIGEERAMRAVAKVLKGLGK